MVVTPTISDVVQIIYRRKWTIMFVALIVAGLGAAYLVTAVPIYRSTASIIVRFGRASVPVTNLARDSTPLVSDQNDRRELIQAHADILTSPDIAQAVIEKFGLARLYPKIAEHPPLVGTAIDAAVKEFQPNLYVSPELAGNVISLGFTHTDPKIAQAVLDTLIEEYMRRESEIFSDTNYTFQKTQADLSYQRLVTAQSDLTAFKASSGVSEFDTQMNLLIKQQSELQTRLNTAQVTLVEATQRRAALTRLLQTVPAVSSSSGDRYRQVDEAQSRVNDLQSRERELTATHGADWPAARALRASIAEAQATASASAAASGGRLATRPSDVYQNLQTDLLRVTAEGQSDEQAVTLMTGQASELEKQIGDLEAHRAGLLERQRAVEIADSAYRSIAMHVEDSRIGVDRLRDGIFRVAVITQPSLPYQPASPRYRLLALSIAAAAVLAGLFFGFIREFLDDRFISGEQVTAKLKVPVLATFDKA